MRDLIDRYQPDVERHQLAPTRERTGAWSRELLAYFYAHNPDGVVNDRWGVPHWDYRTSEYEAGSENESEPAGRIAAESGLSATTEPRASDTH